MDIPLGGGLLSLLLGGLAAIWVLSLLFLIYVLPAVARTALATPDGPGDSSSPYSVQEPQADLLPDPVGLSRSAVLKMVARSPDAWSSVRRLSEYAFDTWGEEWVVKVDLPPV